MSETYGKMQRRLERLRKRYDQIIAWFEGEPVMSTRLTEKADQALVNIEDEVTAIRAALPTTSDMVAMQSEQMGDKFFLTLLPRIIRAVKGLHRDECLSLLYWPTSACYQPARTPQMQGRETFKIVARKPRSRFRTGAGCGNFGYLYELTTFGRAVREFLYQVWLTSDVERIWSGMPPWCGLPPREGDDE